MGGLYRSQEMKYLTITMNNEAAQDTIRELGELGKLHIVDLSSKEAPSKQHLHYKKRVLECGTWERKLKSLEEEMKTRGIRVPDASSGDTRNDDELAALQRYLDPIERELLQSTNFQKRNQQLMSEAEERLHVLNVCQHLELKGVEEVKEGGPRIGGMQADDNMDLPLLSHRDEPQGEAKFRNYVCGTIPVAQQIMFQRMIYRVSRGIAFSRFEDIAEPIEDQQGNMVLKSVFWVVVLGEQLYQRITKMCSIFNATVFPIPDTRDGFEQQITAIQSELREKRQVKDKTNAQIHALLSKVAGHEGDSPLRDWQLAVHKERYICETFMKAHFYLTMISIEGWIPVENLHDLKLCFQRAVKDTGYPVAVPDPDPQSPLREPGSPPTYFKTNKFTQVFQGIVDTYGVPRYMEINPGLFTIITFPFLFGVMYGDIGHGSFLLLSSLYMVFNENKMLEQQRKGTLGEIPSMAFAGRYMGVLMGMFAVYIGFIYNDFFSTPTELFTSRWQLQPDNTSVTNFTYKHVGGTYPFGVDPRWYHTNNELAFFNSLKMKMSVTLGVTQMLFGITLSLFNHLFFKDYASIFFEFVPRMLFMLCTFGYMIFIILYKWTIDWSRTDQSPPNLIQTMIGMFLAPGSVDADMQLYAGQAGFQKFLLIVALLSVPTMLVVKPYLNNKKHKAQMGAQGHRRQHDIEDLEIEEHKDQEVAHGGGGGGHGHGPYSYSDDMIHQGIHTIEFVLGAVSNTASYLRLWALSLAHAELAAVFWDKMMMDYGMKQKSAIMVFIGFAVWAAATFAVLLAMDVLECFLHALRLHWVEFQNKFYAADGYPFQPFTFHHSED
jgi:V-type H+-transporting ATPase subunit a